MEHYNLYSVGRNLTGYLPERSPDLVRGWDSARDSLLWELDSFLDYLTEADDENIDEDAIKACEEAIEELKDSDPEDMGFGFLAYVENQAFWIQAISAEDAEIPEGLTEDELMDRIQDINEAAY